MSRNNRKPRIQVKVEVRKRDLRPLWVGLIILAAMFLWTRTVFGGDWTQFRANPQNTGQAEGTFNANPKPIWSFETGDAIESTAAIVGDTVYIPSMDGYLYALNIKDGSQIWKYHTDAEIKSSPTVHEGEVWFGDEDGILHVVNAKDGKALRKFEAEGALVSSPNFLGDTVFFGGYDNILYALSKKDLKLLWKLETDGYIHATPSLSESHLIVGGCDAYLRIIDPVTGKETGKEPLELGGYVAGSSVIHKGKAYVPTFENQVICIDLAKRDIVWSYEHPDRQFPFYASPALTDKLVIAGGRDKMVHGIDLETGNGKWTFQAKTKVDSSPVVVDKYVVFGDLAGQLFMLEHATGKKVWHYDTGSAVVGSPAISNGRMVIGLDNGMVLCFQ